MQTVSRTTKRIALALSVAVFFVFAGAAVLNAAPTDMHGCAHGPCAAEQTSASFCIAHCLDAARANQGVASATAAVALTFAVVLMAIRSLSVSDPESFRLFSEVRDTFPPLRALRTVVLRE